MPRVEIRSFTVFKKHLYVAMWYGQWSMGNGQLKGSCHHLSSFASVGPFSIFDSIYLTTVCYIRMSSQCSQIGQKPAQISKVIAQSIAQHLLPHCPL